MNRPKNIIFIAGTDTGAGKTVLTGMLLHYLRRQGCHALAMKPFCSGNASDVDLLLALQEGELTAREINPYYFPDPVAPIASRSRKAQKISLPDVVGRIQAMAERCDLLLVEGCGGLKVPITKSLLLIDIISDLQCPVIVVGQNKLGILNHTLLSVESLQSRGLSKVIVALMEQQTPDLSARSNAKILDNLLRPQRVFSIGFAGEALEQVEELKKSSGKVAKIIAHARLRGFIPWQRRDAPSILR